MEKVEQIKVNHHYVWAKYLKNWSNDNDVFYITKRGKIARDSVKGLCRERSFYTLPLLDSEDVNFLTQFSKQCDPFLQELHRGFLTDLIKLSALIRMLQAHPASNGQEFKKIVDVVENNIIENMYAIDESIFLPILEKLTNGDCACLEEPENLINFYQFIGHQITRTFNAKNRTFAGINSNPVLLNQHGEGLKLLEKNWPCISFMFGINVGFNLYAKRTSTKQKFITNTSPVPFITSDNPVINIHPSVNLKDASNPPDHMDIFFAVSPKYAFLICESDAYDDIGSKVTEEIVHHFNGHIYRNSGATIFASSEAVIRDIRSANR